MSKPPLLDIHLGGSLNELATLTHAANINWWIDPRTKTALKRNKGELLMLIVSEIAECMEAERTDAKDGHLTNRAGAEVELADALIRIFDYAGAFGYDIGGAFEEKMKYNAQRLDHKPDERLKPGGKQW